MKNIGKYPENTTTQSIKTQKIALQLRLINMRPDKTFGWFQVCKYTTLK